MHKVKDFLIPAISLAAIVGAAVSIYWSVGGNTSIHTSSNVGLYLSDITQKSELTLQYIDRSKSIVSIAAGASKADFVGIFVPDEIRLIFEKGIRQKITIDKLKENIQNEFSKNKPNTLGIEQLQPFLDSYEPIIETINKIDTNTLALYTSEQDLSNKNTSSLNIDAELTALELEQKINQHQYQLQEKIFKISEILKDGVEKDLNEAKELLNNNQSDITSLTEAIETIENKQIPILQKTINAYSSSGPSGHVSYFSQKLAIAQQEIVYNENLQKKLAKETQPLNAEKEKFEKKFAEKQQEFNNEKYVYDELTDQLSVVTQKAKQQKMLQQNTRAEITSLNSSINIQKNQQKTLEKQKITQVDEFLKLLLQPIT